MADYKLQAEDDSDAPEMDKSETVKLESTNEADSLSPASLHAPPPPKRRGVATKTERKPSARSDASNRRRTALTDLIRQLTDPDRGPFPAGVSPKLLLKQCLTLDMQHRPGQSKNHLQVMLCRMTGKGLITRLQTGFYTVPEFASRYTDAKGEAPEAHETETASNTSSNASGVIEEPSAELATTKTVTNISTVNNHTNIPSSDASIAAPATDHSKTIDVNAKKVTATDKQKVNSGGNLQKKPPAAASRKRQRKPKQLHPDFVSGSSKSSPATLCCVCQMPAALNPLGLPEFLLNCKDCPFRGHPSCLGYGREFDSRYEKNIASWQCDDCKVCPACGSNSKDESVFCRVCDSRVHLKCIGFKEPPSEYWSCSMCQRRARLVEPFPDGESTPALFPKRRRCSAQVAEKAFADGVLRFGAGSTFPTCDCDSSSALADLREDQELREAAAVAEGWSVDEVADFFARQGFRAADVNVFRQQEIDGQALLLLKRADVLTRLALRLGPALKLYRRIFALQSLVATTLKQHK